MEIFPAHIRAEEHGGRISDSVQSVQEHCRRTAEYAGQSLRCVNMDMAAYLAGLLHDCGKFKQEFADYIWDAYHGKSIIRGSVNHTFAGCRMLLEHFHGSVDMLQNLTCELLAFAVGAHHGQFDCIDEKGVSGFRYRADKTGIGYAESKNNFLHYCSDWPELEELFQKAHEQLLPVYKQLLQTAELTDEDAGMEQLMFSIGQLARLILSAVIEGDRRDTAAFMAGTVPTSEKPLSGCFWTPYLQYMESKLRKFPQNTEIKRTRTCFSNLCREAAERPCGIYRLNLPTGGGKTLSSLRYALAHAEKWGKQRIIFVTPLLTILEQNADVIRDFIGDDSIILEHHSNVLESGLDGKELDMRELATESWDAPVIITTLVQLLNTMFLGKTTSVRRYQALCDAVVVIDEVQTVPNRMLSLFNTSVNFLSSVCKTTFLLCSATQPCFEKAEHPLHLYPDSEIVPYSEKYWKPFRRTEICDSGSYCLQQVPGLITDLLTDTNSLLVICNKKKQAEYLYRSMIGENIDLFHLSSSMCMSHRRNILHQVEQSLQNSDRKTVCISTQVMEAGVDISFGCVVRLAAGMDSIVQSAGRCNRNGEQGRIASVHVVRCADEKLGSLKEILAGKQATIALLDAFQKNPEIFYGDISSQKAVNWYYNYLYKGQDTGYQQFTVDSTHVLFQMLAGNTAASEGCDYSRYTLQQAFQTAGEMFYVLDRNMQEVVVPYGEGQNLIAELAGWRGEVPPEKLRNWVIRAKPYTVSLFDYQKKKIAAGIVPIRNVLTLMPEYYSPETGVLTEPETVFMEV